VITLTHSLNDPQIMRQIIMDHYQYPRNKRIMNSENYQKIHVGSDGCIDSIDLFTLVENGVIKDIAFEGVACAISTASTSIMSELLKNKKVEDANHIIQHYLNMISEKPYDEALMEEAIVFKNTYKQANRIKCATVSWLGLQEMINKK
jgi:nitrogen fixation protein NifU and related proteins